MGPGRPALAPCAKGTRARRRLGRMEYTHVGHLGLVVSRVCLGTMNFGPHTPEADSHTIMDAALAHGVNFFDTANVYGRHLGVGATEEIIGRWFAKGSHRRDEVVLATKVFGTMGDWPNESRLSKYAIIHQCEASLRSAPDGPHRPLSDAPHRPCRVVGRDLGGDGSAEAPGEDPLRRLVELRRLAHRARERDRELAALARPRDRAVDLQPARADRRARGDPRDRRVRHGHDPVQPARRRSARRARSRR